MMSNGFITEADVAKTVNGDQSTTDLHIEDLDNGTGDDEKIIRIWISDNNVALFFTKHEADALVEAIQEILERYQTPA